MTEDQFAQLAQNLDDIIRESTKFQAYYDSSYNQVSSAYQDGKIHVARLVKMWLEQAESGEVVGKY